MITYESGMVVNVIRVLQLHPDFMVVPMDRGRTGEIPAHNRADFAVLDEFYVVIEHSEPEPRGFTYFPLCL